MSPMIYRCQKECMLRKKCFILKTETEIEQPIIVLVKCIAQHGKDIRITIGGGANRPP